MKRKFLLALLPAALIVSVCSGFGIKAKSNITNLFKEDTLAHEELFDSSELMNGVGYKQPLRAAADVVEPTIGVQFQNYTKEYGGKERNYCAIRYVASIASRHVRAEWIRGVSWQNGHEIKAKGTKESLVAYDSINNNGSVLKAASGSCFVVYTLYDIPLFDYDTVTSCYWSYVAAGLKLTDLDGEAGPTMSAIVAVEIGAHHCFSFHESDLEGKDFFLEGKVNGSLTDPIKPLNSGGVSNRVEQTLELKAGDNFGVFEWSSDYFRFFGNHDCTYDAYNIRKSEKISTNYSLVGVDHEYTLYLNNDDDAKYGLSPTGGALSKPTTIYLNVKGTVWLSDPVIETFAVWQTSLNDWVTATSNSDGVYKFDDVDTSHQFIFVRYSKDADPNWSWGNHCQTNNIDYSTFIMDDTFTITGWDDGGNDHAGYLRSSSVE